MATVGTLIWLLLRLISQVKFKFTFLWKFSHNRCNNMGLPPARVLRWRAICTLMMFLLGIMIHMTGRASTISQLKYWYCLFVKCIVKFRLNYVSDKIGVASVVWSYSNLYIIHHCLESLDYLVEKYSTYGKILYVEEDVGWNFFKISRVFRCTITNNFTTPSVLSLYTGFKDVFGLSASKI